MDRTRENAMPDPFAPCSPVAGRFEVPPRMRARAPAIGTVRIRALAAPPAMVALTAYVAREVFGATIEVLPARPLPEHAFETARRQHDAEVLLDELFDDVVDDRTRVVGLCDADLFAPGRTFVFGYAHLQDRVAVVSLSRMLVDAPADDDRVRWRLYKTLVHELGHTFGIAHCDEPRCAMREVGLLPTLDELAAEWGPRCEALVRRGLAQPQGTAHSLLAHGGSLLRRRRPLGAAAVLARAAGLAPESAECQNDLGVALLAAGDRLGAARAFRRALALRPDLYEAQRNLRILRRAS
jgi:archaemetzincin